MKKLVVAGSLAMFAVGAIGAENQGWYVAPKLGYTMADSDRQVDDAGAFGLAVGKRLNDRWALELNGLTGAHDADAGGDLDITAFSADVLRHFNTGGRVSPFLTAGVGSLTNDRQPGGSREGFMLQTGAGLMIRAWENATGSTTFSLRPEAKLRWDDAGGSGHLMDVLAGIGFQFDFGGTKRAVAVPVVATTPVAAPAPAPAPVAPPPAVDSDGDGVLDDADQCPDTPRGTAVDARGCPRKGSITLVGVNFENNSARLLPESLAVLNSIASDLQRYSRLKVEVQGHTDSVGSDVYNQNLSQNRAVAVRDYLVTQGVAAAQLTAQGYGESRPVAANDTTDGRARNRRVALEVLDNPGDVEVKKGQ